MNYTTEELDKLPLKEVWDLEDLLKAQSSVVSEYIDNKIWQLARGGWTQERIAKEVGRTHQTVSRRMMRLGIEPMDARGRGAGLRAGARTKALELAENGLSYRAIAKELGMDESSIRRSKEIRAIKEGPASTRNSGSAACAIESAPQLIRRIQADLKLVTGSIYTLNTNDQEHLRNILREAERTLNDRYNVQVSDRH